MVDFLPPANEVWSKVIFSEACVKKSVHRGDGIPACLKGIWGSLQAHTWVGIPACTEADPPTDGYCCGRYASYWNAFLLHINLLFHFMLVYLCRILHVKCWTIRSRCLSRGITAQFVSFPFDNFFFHFRFWYYIHIIALSLLN